MTQQFILTLNAGSSSVKFSVFDAGDSKLSLRYYGQVEGIGSAPRFVAKTATGTILTEHRWEPAPIGAGHANAFAHLGRWLIQHIDNGSLAAVGHRVAHGGPHFSHPVRIDEAVLTQLKSLVPLAPLHQPHNLSGIRAVFQEQPDLPQVACFDTAFHQNRAPVTERFGLPSELFTEGVRRYGFHGLSYEYIAQTLSQVAPELASGRVITAHLGSGASLCALQAGKSVDTTMSFSTLDGLPMGTRCGTLDPGVLVYLMREKNMDVDAIESLLYQRSGLLGISGLSNDVRRLLASDEPSAAEAIDYFVYRIRREVGSLAAALQGVDGLVFTAGIGEHSADIRSRVCQGLDWLGVELDESANRTGAPTLSTARSAVRVMLIPTDEERMIAQHTATVLGDRFRPATH